MTRLKRLFSFVSTLLLITLPVVGWTQRQNLYDSWRLHGYQPPAAVAQLATDTTMSDKTRRLFYVQHPALEDKATFSFRCRSGEKTIVLGCYIAGEGIYLSNVTDARLAGVVQVTAAHETLHAAYDRLGRTDKDHVNQLIDQAYAQVTDQRIRNTIEDYRKNGADTVNELHSILGTEVRALPAELEQYYARYFTNRLAVVAYSEAYEQAFTERKQKIIEDDQALAALKQQIDGAEASLDGRARSFERPLGG